MGMGYNYAGSASYPRFDKELCKVAEVFGGVKIEHLKNREFTENERPFGYWFGSLSSDDSGEDKFIFPECTDETLVKWFNNVYGDFTIEETVAVCMCFDKHPEIEEISSQIWQELGYLLYYGEAWDIC